MVLRNYLELLATNPCQTGSIYGAWIVGVHRCTDAEVFDVI